MAVPKVCGIETEYGIIVRGDGQMNPIAASSVLVNAYLASLSATVEHSGGTTRRVDWDFEDETPANDARGESLVRAFAPEVETHLVNAVLTNGSRFYVDHAHPELSTPECRTPMQALLYDRAGEEILERAMVAARSSPGLEGEVVVYKNNSDGKGQSYGCHENYLLSRSLGFGEIVTAATIHLVTRQIYTGAGKVGAETPGARSGDSVFQLTQRADFFEEEVGLETTLKRPIVNTRDEPHADPRLYRRLHVITGDANMAETATFLKLGTTALVLAALEDGALGGLRALATPVPAMRSVSRDVGLRIPLETVGGGSMTALDVQWELLGRCRRYVDADGGAALGDDDARTVLDVWEQVLSGLEADPMTLHRELDWVAKLRLLTAYKDRHDLHWSDPRLAAMDLQYHDVRRDRSLARRVGLATLVEPDEVTRAVSVPPADTRAYFRGTCLAKFPDDVVAANWDSMVFDVGAVALKRVPMMDPLKGTKAHVGEVLDRADSTADLLAALSA